MSTAIAAAALRGAMAGGVGTGVVQLIESMDEWLLRRPPLFAPASLANRLSRAWRGHALRPRTAALAGSAMRWTYGPAWGALFALAGHRRFRATATTGLALGAAVALFESAALPGARAAPPVLTWPRIEIALLIGQSVVFGWVTARAFARFADPPGL